LIEEYKLWAFRLKDMRLFCYQDIRLIDSILLTYDG